MASSSFYITQFSGLAEPFDSKQLPRFLTTVPFIFAPFLRRGDDENDGLPLYRLCYLIMTSKSKKPPLNPRDPIAI